RHDLFDPDPDLEAEPDSEPNMGWTESEARYGRYSGPQDDDREPSLGSSDNRFCQIDWASGTRDEREDKHDGREPDVDDEPSLGSLNRVNQRGWGSSGTNDLEDEHDGREPSEDSITEKDDDIYRSREVVEAVIQAKANAKEALMKLLWRLKRHAENR